MSGIQIGFPSGHSERIGLSIMGLMESPSVQFSSKDWTAIYQGCERISALRQVVEDLHDPFKLYDFSFLQKRMSF